MASKEQMKPTPETDAEEAIDNGDTKPLLEFARKLERERDAWMALATRTQGEDLKRKCSGVKT
jgi:hypothetical protein